MKSIFHLRLWMMVLFSEKNLKWTGYMLNPDCKMRQGNREKQKRDLWGKKRFQGIVSQEEKAHLHTDKNKVTCYWMWDPIELGTTQLKTEREWPWRDGLRMCLLPSSDRQQDISPAWLGCWRHSGFNTAMQMTKSLAVWQQGAFSKLIQPGRGLFKSTANCWYMWKQTAHVSAHHGPNRQRAPPVAWKWTSGQTNTLHSTQHICDFLNKTKNKQWCMYKVWQ